jgi:hypothetical protein
VFSTCFPMSSTCSDTQSHIEFGFLGIEPGDLGGFIHDTLGVFLFPARRAAANRQTCAARALVSVRRRT